jgi:hypothetical protein
MTDKPNFTPHEWKLLLGSVMMAGIAVTTSDLNGLWGLLKESLAGGSALEQARMNVGSNPLINAVVADLETAQGRTAARDSLKESLTGADPMEIKTTCIRALRQAAVLVEVKAPGDASAFKDWLRQISQHVAEASQEGARLGFGGAAVSEAEQATLTEISDALDIAA